MHGSGNEFSRPKDKRMQKLRPKQVWQVGRQVGRHVPEGERGKKESHAGRQGLW